MIKQHLKFNINYYYCYYLKWGFDIQLISSEILFNGWFLWLKYIKGKVQGKHCNKKDWSWRNSGLATETFSPKANKRSVQTWATKTVRVQTYKPVQTPGHKSTVPSGHHRTTRTLIYKSLNIIYVLITLYGTK